MDTFEKSLSPIRSVAIVGSGVSGLTVGIRLQELGVKTVVFEKSRGPGGRLAAKRVPGGAVDIGAQYFTIRSRAFRTFLDRYAGEHRYAAWPANLRYQHPEKGWSDFISATRYVGVPRMTAISRSLAEHLDVRYETRIARIERDDHQRWAVIDTRGQTQGYFDAVVVTAPPVQAKDLLADSGIDMAQQDAVFHDFPLQACWTVAAHFSQPLGIQADGFGTGHPVLQWAANNSSKPGRESPGEWWVLHARADWSEMHRNAAEDWIREQMLNAFGEVAGSRIQPDDTLIHRWLYAKTSNNDAAPGHRWYSAPRIGLCGDWLQGGRVEGAYESAESLIGELRESKALS
ncbi:NAD(P)/FAD-dependent oxidoreductase [Marinobacter fonticola]|uniref:NAD(P)/FAD-dependent oxidoreductase n=1 Tax=Marinobacter fonticola TaxID=2603215 RepID=UPI0011E66EAE|nr:FAD-dependent oxidoreductase [Marinobacter fonticola]